MSRALPGVVPGAVAARRTSHPTRLVAAAEPQARLPILSSLEARNRTCSYTDWWNDEVTAEATENVPKHPLLPAGKREGAKRKMRAVQLVAPSAPLEDSSSSDSLSEPSHDKPSSIAKRFAIRGFRPCSGSSQLEIFITTMDFNYVVVLYFFLQLNILESLRRYAPLLLAPPERFRGPFGPQIIIFTSILSLDCTL